MSVFGVIFLLPELKRENRSFPFLIPATGVAGGVVLQT
jgi:hypothetical protein